MLPVLLIALGLATAYFYGQRPPRSVVELRGAALGTTWSVKLAATDLDPDDEQVAVYAASESLGRVDALMSTWRDDSALSRFNASATTEPVAMADEVLAVFAVAQAVSARSRGAFDVTVAPLVQAWGFGSDGRRDAPGDEELSALGQRVGYQKLRIDVAGGTLAKTHPEVTADLSAVAKGYAVDAVTAAIERLGHERYLVEVGGELRARGGHLDGRPWRVAIEAPDAEGRSIHRIVALQGMAMATSGDYRNYYERDGRRLSHTVDPRTLRPIEHGLASVTVLHPEAAWADAWATALNVLGPDAGYALALDEGLAAYFIVRRADDGAGPGFELRMTPGFEPHLVPPPDAADGGSAR